LIFYSELLIVQLSYLISLYIYLLKFHFMKRGSMKKVIVGSIVIICFYCSTAKAQTDAVNVVTTAVPFLRISPDARAGGMGDVGIATSPDANSSFWNVAKIPFNKSATAIGVTYTPWLKDLGLGDVYLASLAAYHKFGDNQAISASLRYFSLGNIQFTDYSGNPLGQGNPREMAFDFGYSRLLSDKLSLGVTARYIHSALASGSISGVTYKAGDAVAADIALYHNSTDKEGAGLTWGATLSNLGSKIGYTNDAQNKDFIPANLGLGIGYTMVFDETSKLTFALDLNKLLVPIAPTVSGNVTTDSVALANYRSSSVLSSWFKSFSDGSNQLKTLQASIGIEYSYDDQFMVRAGYYYEDASRGNRKYFSVGAGLKYNIIGVNFSYLVPSGNGVNRNPLSNTLRFGLTFDLDKSDGNKD
jgi:hypothetical protein